MSSAPSSSTPVVGGAGGSRLLGVYVALGMTLLVVLVAIGWGAWLDLREARAGLLRAEVHRLRSHAIRTVMRIQDELVESGEGNTLEQLGDIAWLHDHWNRFVPTDSARLYAAVVDSEGKVLLHHQRELEGQRLAPDWRAAAIPEVGDDVFETRDPALTGGMPSWDIAIPIVLHERELGTYHSGFNRTWFDGESRRRQFAAAGRWLVAFGAIALAVVLAGVSLVRISRRIALLEGAVALAEVRRLADLGQFAGGVAHEIRNPLNVVRLNLHVIKSLLSRRLPEPDEQMLGVMDETVREMGRVEGLLRSLLEYARPERARVEVLDLADETRSVLRFVAALAEQSEVALAAELPAGPCTARVDPARYRQVVLNLVKNALEAVPHGGQVVVRLGARGEFVELAVADNGPGIPPERRAEVFQPFYTTKDLGTGLGLTLVRRFVEEVGGRVAVEANEPQGTVFRVWWPRAVPDSAASIPEPAQTGA